MGRKKDPSISPRSPWRVGMWSADGAGVHAPLPHGEGRGATIIRRLWARQPPSRGRAWRHHNKMFVGSSIGVGPGAPGYGGSSIGSLPNGETDACEGPLTHARHHRTVTLDSTSTRIPIHSISSHKQALAHSSPDRMPVYLYMAMCIYILKATEMTETTRHAAFTVRNLLVLFVSVVLVILSRFKSFFLLCSSTIVLEKSC